MSMFVRIINSRPAVRIEAGTMVSKMVHSIASISAFLLEKNQSLVKLNIIQHLENSQSFLAGLL